MVVERKTEIREPPLSILADASHTYTGTHTLWRVCLWLICVYILSFMFFFGCHATIIWWNIKLYTDVCANQLITYYVLCSNVLFTGFSCYRIIKLVSPIGLLLWLAISITENFDKKIKYSNRKMDCFFFYLGLPQSVSCNVHHYIWWYDILSFRISYP